jgi:hypothetical protein
MLIKLLGNNPDAGVLRHEGTGTSETVPTNSQMIHEKITRGGRKRQVVDGMFLAHSEVIPAHKTTCTGARVPERDF